MLSHSSEQDIYWYISLLMSRKGKQVRKRMDNSQISDDLIINNQLENDSPILAIAAQNHFERLISQ
jgi:hypothetical protein